MPPPIPVSMPSKVAITGFSPCARALLAPGHGEERQSCGVEQQHRVPFLADAGRESRT